MAPVLFLCEMVPDGGGQCEAAAHKEIGEVAHEGGGGALEQQLQQNFNALNGDGSAWSQEEAAQQHGHLGEVQLVEFRGQEGQGKVQNVQHHGDGRANADNADPSGGAYMAQMGEFLFRQLGDHGQRNNDGGSDSEKRKVFLGLRE